MPEIERKWRILKAHDSQLFANKVDVTGPGAVEIDQFYLAVQSGEVRLRRRGPQYLLTIKGDGGLTRGEVEVEVPAWTFKQLVSSARGNIISKTRVSIVEAGITYEVDIYSGRFFPLVVLEIEFDTEEAARGFILPEWVLDANPVEVTEDPKYKNKSLALRGLPGLTD